LLDLGLGDSDHVSVVVDYGTTGVARRYGSGELDQAVTKGTHDAIRHAAAQAQRGAGNQHRLAHARLSLRCGKRHDHELQADRRQVAGGVD